MTYYSDLSPYEYGLIPIYMDGDVVNVGWLDADSDYQKGDVPDAFLERLWTFCQWPVLHARGYHNCNLCEPPSDQETILVQCGDEIIEIPPLVPIIKVQHGNEIVELGKCRVACFWVKGSHLRCSRLDISLCYRTPLSTSYGVH